MWFLFQHDSEEFWQRWKSQYGSHGNNETVISDIHLVMTYMKVLLQVFYGILKR